MRSFFVFISLALAAQAPAQVLTASKILGGSGRDAATAVALDSQGNVFVAGTTTSGDFPIVNGLISKIPDAGLRVSTDGRTFHSSAFGPANVAALASTADGHMLLASAADGIYRTTDSGANWTGPQSVVGLAVALAIDPVNPGNAYAIVAAPNGGTLFYRSADGGASWQEPGEFPNQGQLSRIVIDPQHPATVFLSFSDALYQSFDSGNNWTKVFLPATLAFSGQATPSALAFAPSQPQTIYAATYASPLLKSVDGGMTWQAMAFPTIPILPNSMAVDPQDPNMVWVANGAGIQRTVDGGASFQTVMKVPGGSWISLVIDPGNSSHVFAADYLHVYSTLDGGATWNVAASGQVNGLLATPLSIFAAGQVTQTLFLAKLDASLSRILFSTFIGPVAGNIAIAVDSNGNPLVTGVTQAQDFPVSANALNNTFSSNAAGFAMKVKGDGSALLYSTFLGNFFPTGAAFDAAGAVVIVGSTQTDVQTTAKAYQPAAPGQCGQPLLFGQLFGGAPSGHGFAAKLSADGSSLLWGTYLAGTCGDVANAVQLDAAGNAHITGSTASPDFPVTQDAMTSTYPGLNTSGFFSELSADGSKLIYSSFFGAGANNGGTALTLDGHGSVLIGGYTQAKPSVGALAATHVAGCQPVFFIGPSSDTSYQGNDGFVMKMTLSAAPPIFLATIGGSCQDAVSSLSVDGAGDIWVSGTTASSDFPTLAPIGAFGAGTGGFVAEIDRTGSNLLFSTFTGGGVTAADANAGAFFAGSIPAASHPSSTSAVVSHIDANQVSSVAVDSIQAPVSQLPQNPPYFAAPAVAPGQLLVLKGRNMGPSNPVFAKLGADGRFPFTLGGVQVMFDGVAAAALVSVGAKQIECQVPFGLDGSVLTKIQVQYQGQMSNSFAAAVVSQQVAILAVSNSDGTGNSVSNPAQAGSVVTLYLSGVGQTSPAGIDGGVNASSSISPRAPLKVYVDNASAQPAFLGAAPGESSAVFQLNLQVPRPGGGGNGDNINILSSSGQSQALVRVYVK